MGFRFFWNSQQGTRTPHNQDYGGIGLRAGTTLVMVADGASTRRQSGELADALVKTVIDSFVTSTRPATPEDVLDWLRQSHEALSTQFPFASASYVIACIEETGGGFSLHAGDCLLGYTEGNDPVEWILRPHTLANPIEDVDLAHIAADPARHRLTRGFRAREFVSPSVAVFAPGTGDILLASDGFWAELDHQGQRQVMDGRNALLADGADDRSVLLVQRLQEIAGHQITKADRETNNLYVRDAHRARECPSSH